MLKNKIQKKNEKKRNKDIITVFEDNWQLQETTFLLTAHIHRNVFHLFAWSIDTFLRPTMHHYRQ